MPSGLARGRAFATLLLVAPLAWAQLDGAMRMRASVPEPRALAYEAVGRWLEATAAPSQRVAVMEVGIMGYYARRPMVDLLGLIRPETISALRRQDFFWTIAKFEADWVVLTGRNPLWFQDAPPDHWFHSYYAPAHTHDQPGFWGTPLTVYRLQAPKRPAVLETLEAQGRFGDALRLDSALITGKHLRPGDYLTIVLSWRALRAPGRDYSAFVHVVNDEPRVVAQHDTSVIASRWPVGEAVEYFHPIRLPTDLPPGRYRLEVGLYLPEEPLKRLPPLDAPHPRHVGVLGEITVGR